MSPQHKRLSYCGVKYSKAKNEIPVMAMESHILEVMAMESHILEILLAYVKQGRKSCKLRDMHGRERPT
jgi:hypothetical protein